MAPAKTDDPLSQLLAKIEEGNKETHRRMEAIQGAVGNMEAAVKVVMTEQGDLQKWKPEVEAKVTEISDALKAIQIQMGKMEKKPLGFGSRQEEEGEDGFLKPPPSDSSNLEFRREEGRTQFSHGVLGMNWIQQYSPMKVDWANKWAVIPYNGSPAYLQGVQVTLPAGAVTELLLLSVESQATPAGQSVDPKVQAVLDQFVEVFEDPVGLPPSRTCDHTIPLVPGTNVCVLPLSSKLSQCQTMLKMTTPSGAAL
ncbi:uncharacterized protein LOC100384518 isoform 1 [Zea mays]|uniref:Uncharacterized protein n=1 Tax=Zea mays TaxID=4577 RepID=B6SM86_MAIZE|nr:uncharacterized protein LOC100384518 isoform 1 [Zea mays]ACG25969.1 hypothetical protein [Zea mays]|eukprot:NP_001142693.1 uncharacterized protein LOC100384518 isoform 1 [Zea mays]